MFATSGNLNSYEGMEMYVYDGIKIGSLFLTNFELSLDLNIHTYEILSNLKNSPLTNKNSVFLFKFFVHERYRSRGFGKKLISEVSNFLYKNKIDYLFLNCNIENKRAIKFYQTNDFIELGRNHKDILFYKMISS